MADNGALGSSERVEVEWVDADGDIGDDLFNTAPAYESGPHLLDPEVRAAKLAQMQAAGMTSDDADLTDDMRDILAEVE